MSPRELQCPGDKRRVNHRDATQNSGRSTHDYRLSCWRHGISLP
jgi:hypothetical protein